MNFFLKLLPSRESLVTDADFFLTNLDSTLFPGISSDIKVHSGFASDQASYDLHLVASTHLNRHDSTATDVLAAVQKTMSEYGTTNVTMVGHSLGEYLRVS